MSLFDYKKILPRTVKFFKKHWKLIAFIVLIILVGTFLYYRRQQRNKVELTFTNPRVETLTKTIEVSGVVDAKQKASMRFAAGGKVVYLGAQEGDYVKKWQTIATIDQRDLQKKLKKDLNLYLQERWDWEQTLDDTRDRWLPEREVRTKDKEQWDLDNTVLDVEIRDIAISNTVLAAPFAGVLVSSPTSVAGVSLLSTQVFELIDPSTLIFRAAVDEADIALVKEGQRATITLDAHPDQSIETFVNYISFTSSESTSGTVFIVEMQIIGEDLLSRYRIGMHGDVEITLETRSSILTIPLDATRQRDQETYVDVRTGAESFEERLIEIGLETDEQLEVLDGLSEDDEILLP